MSQFAVRRGRKGSVLAIKTRFLMKKSINIYAYALLLLLFARIKDYYVYDHIKVLLRRLRGATTRDP